MSKTKIFVTIETDDDYKDVDAAELAELTLKGLEGLPAVERVRVEKHRQHG